MFLRFSLLFMIFLVACRPDPVTVLNDTAKDVRLVACEFLNPIPLKQGQSKEIRPTRACSVYTGAKYRGFLHIPAEAYKEGARVLVSTFVASISQPDCAGINAGRSPSN